MNGIPPPEGMPRDCWASWYFQQILEAEMEHAEWMGTPSGRCREIRDLIAGAEDAGVMGHEVTWWGCKPHTLSSLLERFERDAA